MELDDKVYIELTWELTFDLLKGIADKVTFEKGEDLKQRGLGIQYMNKLWIWNEENLRSKPAIYMYNLYKEIKTGKHEPEQ